MIEKYKSPTGDGNLFPPSFPLCCFIEKYKSPTGDGNVASSLSR